VLVAAAVVLPVPGGANGMTGELSLAAAGVLDAVGSLSLAGGAMSGVEDAVLVAVLSIC
jgi:hypothetical protein